MEMEVLLGVLGVLGLGSLGATLLLNHANRASEVRRMRLTAYSDLLRAVAEFRHIAVRPEEEWDVDKEREMEVALQRVIAEASVVTLLGPKTVDAAAFLRSLPDAAACGEYTDQATISKEMKKALGIR